MKLQELIDELSQHTDGAAEEPGWRSAHAAFPEITTTRVLYKKVVDNTIELSQILVYVEDIDKDTEAAYYEKGRVPSPVIEAAKEPITYNATPEEIKENLDALFPSDEFPKYWDIRIQGGEEAGLIIGTFYDPGTDTVSDKAYRVVQDEKGTFSKFLVKG